MPTCCMSSAPFATTKLIRAGEWLQVAIKFLERGSPAIRIADREVLNMQMCSMHPNIIQFREVSPARMVR